MAKAYFLNVLNEDFSKGRIYINSKNKIREIIINENISTNETESEKLARHIFNLAVTLSMLENKDQRASLNLFRTVFYIVENKRSIKAQSAYYLIQAHINDGVYEGAEDYAKYLKANRDVLNLDNESNKILKKNIRKLL